MYELLVVDDEVNSRNTLCTCFPWEDIGFHVCGQADKGKEALAFMNQHAVHVVFTDVSMPVMSGIELAQTISNMKGVKPTVVFLSAHDDFKYAQEALRYNVRYYILKPSNFNELRSSFEIIRTELDNKYNVRASADFSASGDDTMKKVLEYCESNYREGTLAEIADQLYLNTSYLSSLIKQKTSLNFSDHIQNARMKQAALLLRDPNVKIYNISDMVGYLNPNNFARAFKLYYGMSPSEYRMCKLSEHEE